MLEVESICVPLKSKRAASQPTLEASKSHDTSMNGHEPGGSGMAQSRSLRRLRPELTKNVRQDNDFESSPKLNTEALLVPVCPARRPIAGGLSDG